MGKKKRGKDDNVYTESGVVGPVGFGYQMVKLNRRRKEEGKTKLTLILIGSSYFAWYLFF